MELDLKASVILGKCIEDIDAGKWICGQLDEWKGPVGGPNSKQMGCAIGLVSLNSGYVKERKSISNPGFTYVCAKYIADSTEEDPAPQGAKDAVKYLSEQVPEKERNYSLSGLSNQESNVVDYNDGYCDTPAVAKEWFTRAYDQAVKEGK